MKDSKTWDLRRTLFGRSLSEVEHYRSDLLVDDQMIRENPGIPFIHITRSTGTDLQLLFPADSEHFPPKGQTVPYLFGKANREHIADGIVSMIRYHAERNESISYRYFDGESLALISRELAVETVEIWRERIADSWEREPWEKYY